MRNLLPARRRRRRADKSGGGMFVRFTDQARRAVVLAHEEARTLDHHYIGTEHILLGLLHEGDGVAAKSLQALGISLPAVRQQVEEIIGHGKQAVAGHIPFTPRAKKVMQLSRQEAANLGSDHIATEHILLGLIREGSGVAAQVLTSLGADLGRLRQQVVRLAAAAGKDGIQPGGTSRALDEPAAGGRPRMRSSPETVSTSRGFKSCAGHSCTYRHCVRTRPMRTRPATGCSSGPVSSAS